MTTNSPPFSYLILIEEMILGEVKKILLPTQQLCTESNVQFVTRDDIKKNEEKEKYNSENLSYLYYRHPVETVWPTGESGQ